MPDPAAPTQPPTTEVVPAQATAPAETAPAPGKPVDVASLYARLTALYPPGDGFPGFDSLEDYLDHLEEAAKLPQETPMPDPVAPVTAPQSPAAAPAPTPTAPSPAAAPPVQPAQARPSAQAKPAAGRPTAQQADDLAHDRSLSPSARAKWAKYRDDMNGRLSAETAKAQQFEQRYTEAEQRYQQAVVEQDLKVELARAGIRDLDYAWFQLKKHIDTMAKDKSPEGVQAFRAFSEGGTGSVRAWADQQRAATPYIFGEMPMPASTGVGTGGSPPPSMPGAPNVAATAARAGAFDARTASKEDMEARMRELGINYRDARAPMRR